MHVLFLSPVAQKNYSLTRETIRASHRSTGASQYISNMHNGPQLPKYYAASATAASNVVPVKVHGWNREDLFHAMLSYDMILPVVEQERK